MWFLFIMKMEVDGLKLKQFTCYLNVDIIIYYNIYDFIVVAGMEAEISDAVKYISYCDSAAEVLWKAYRLTYWAL